MKSVWFCTCTKCGREIADSDKQAFDFKRGGWIYDRESGDWTCDKCVDEDKKEGAK
jgi:hypothetical protein